MAGARTRGVLHRLGIPDLYGGVGKREDLLAKYGLDSPSIAIRVEEALEADA
jgi:transketolase C-terminal domain/subunit